MVFDFNSDNLGWEIQDSERKNLLNKGNNKITYFANRHEVQHRLSQIASSRVKSTILDTKKKTTKPTRSRPYSTLLDLTKTVASNVNEKHNNHINNFDILQLYSSSKKC